MCFNPSFMKGRIMELFRFEETSKFTKSIVKPAVPDLPLNHKHHTHIPFKLLQGW